MVASSAPNTLPLTHENKTHPHFCLPGRTCMRHYIGKLCCRRFRPTKSMRTQRINRSDIRSTTKKSDPPPPLKKNAAVAAHNGGSHASQGNTAVAGKGTRGQQRGAEKITRMLPQCFKQAMNFEEARRLLHENQKRYRRVPQQAARVRIHGTFRPVCF